MVINDCRSMDTTPIADLAPGDVFEYESNFYLVTKDKSDKTAIAVVNLTTGEILYVDGRKGVRYIDDVELLLRD